MEGAGDGRCSTVETQGEHEDKASHEEGQDAEGLRKSLWYLLLHCVHKVNAIQDSHPADSTPVVPDMKLTANVGSDRSWVWNAAADVSEGEPEAVTLAIRFANSDSKFQAALSSCAGI